MSPVIFLVIWCQGFCVLWLTVGMTLRRSIVSEFFRFQRDRRGGRKENVLLSTEVWQRQSRESTNPILNGWLINFPWPVKASSTWCDRVKDRADATVGKNLLVQTPVSDACHWEFQQRMKLSVTFIWQKLESIFWDADLRSKSMKRLKRVISCCSLSGYIS